MKGKEMTLEQRYELIVNFISSLSIEQKTIYLCTIIGSTFDNNHLAYLNGYKDEETYDSVKGKNNG